MNTKRKLFGVIGIALLSNTILIGGGLWFLSSQIIGRYTLLRNQLASAAALDNELDALLRIKEDTRGREKDFASLEKLFYKEDEFIEYIQAIEQIARSQRVEVRLESPTLLTTPTTPYRQVFSISATGSFTGVMQFMKLVELYSVRSRFDSVSLTGTGDRVQLTGKLTVATQ